MNRPRRTSKKLIHAVATAAAAVAGCCQFPGSGGGVAVVESFALGGGSLSGALSYCSRGPGLTTSATAAAAAAAAALPQTTLLPTTIVASSCRQQNKLLGGSGSRYSGSKSRSRRAAVVASTSALAMVQNRGLEIQEEGATPLPGGMTLYIKAGPDGTSVGDCPFAHYVRTVLHEKGLEYELRPSTAQTKPQWLVDFYDGAMPALRHRKECYTESDVIGQYLDFFFSGPSYPPMSAKKVPTRAAMEAVDGLFPAIAKYLKHTPDGDDDDMELRDELVGALTKLEEHLAADDDDDSNARTGPYLVGDGDMFTLVDASLAPKLYHMEVGMEAFKKEQGDDDNNASINVGEDFPNLRNYMDAVFARKSFVDALYPRETIVWGWNNARGTN